MNQSFRRGQHAASPGPLSPVVDDSGNGGRLVGRPIVLASDDGTNSINNSLERNARIAETTSKTIPNQNTFISSSKTFMASSDPDHGVSDQDQDPADDNQRHLRPQHRRLSSSTIHDTTPQQHPDVLMNKEPPLGTNKKKRTLVVYSGPTSLDRTIGKNDVYLTNFEYFLQHGIECHGVIGGGPDDDSSSNSQLPRVKQKQRMQQTHADTEPSHIQYVIVLTQEVADKYTSQDGLITQKQTECSPNLSQPQNNDNSLITVLVREDKCYDMESILVVLRTIDVPQLYDHFVYMNCGLAGPKFGPGSPSHWKNLSSWTELYTSLLDEKVQMVGHTVNTHFNTVYSPHIQSFLFAVNTPMIDIWLKTGALYDCGISNEEFKDDILRMALVWRYEVGISRVLLERGYSIAAAFMHQGGKIGVPLIIDSNSSFGRNLTEDQVLKSDIFKENGLRMLSESSFPEIGDPRKYDILPWDTYVFFKVSRLVPYDIQRMMEYKHLGNLPLVPNDARQSSIREWRRKSGISLWGDFWHLFFGYSSDIDPRSIRCHYGPYCELDTVPAEMEIFVGVAMISVLFVSYFIIMKFVERRLNIQRSSSKRRKSK